MKNNPMADTARPAKKSAALPIAVAAAGIILMAAGVLLGENGDILRKGVNICLECIGIG